MKASPTCSGHESGAFLSPSPALAPESCPQKILLNPPADGPTPATALPLSSTAQAQSFLPGGCGLQGLLHLAPQSLLLAQQLTLPIYS